MLHFDDYEYDGYEQVRETVGKTRKPVPRLVSKKEGPTQSLSQAEVENLALRELVEAMADHLEKVSYSLAGLAFATNLKLLKRADPFRV